MKLFNNYIIGAIRIILGISTIYYSFCYLIGYSFTMGGDLTSPYPLDYEDYGKIIGVIGASIVFIIYNLIEGFQNLNNKNLDVPKWRLFSIICGLLFLFGGVNSMVKSIEYIYPISPTFLYYTAFLLITFKDIELYKKKSQTI